MTRLFVVLICLLATPIGAQTEAGPVEATFDALPTVAKVANVRPGLELNVRAGPGTQFEVLGRLDRFTRNLEVTAVVPGWARINFGERIAWVSRNFLEETPGAAALSCFGTEPFWSANWLGDSGIWTTPEMRLEDPSATLLEGSQSRALVMTFEGETTTILVERSECSDGASDRLYGLRATAVQGRDRLETGCCSVLLGQ
jgi:uncharacterized membrane protein